MRGQAREAAAAGKGCPGNRAGLHSGSEPNSKMQNDRLHGRLLQAQRHQRNEGRPGERKAQGEMGAHAVIYNLPPSREEKERE